jgi:hypothetical protein
LRAGARDLTDGAAKGCVRERLARKLIGKTIRRHADRADEALPNAFFDDALEKRLFHTGEATTTSACPQGRRGAVAGLSKNLPYPRFGITVDRHGENTVREDVIDS